MRGSGLRPAAVVAAVAAYSVAAVALLVAGTDPVAITTLGLLTATGLAVALLRLQRHGRAGLARLAGDIDVVAGANPAHRLPVEGPDELAAVARAVNRLAEAREAARRDAEETAQDLRNEVETERNRLADLMARLGVAVVVCNGDGRILLYNDLARSLVADPALLGLGRTVFGLVDRGLLVHARRRLEAGAGTYTATTLHRGRMLRVHVAPAPGPSETPVPGLVLVLEDRTRQARVADERQRTSRRLVEETRGSLGSIRAAADALLEFPDLGDEARRRFLEVVREETDRLGGRLDEAAVDLPPTEDHGVDDIAAADLVTVLGDRLRRDGVVCDAEPSPGPAGAWVRADAHALAAVLAFVVDRLGGPHLEGATLGATQTPDHVRVELRWTGGPPDPAELTAWLDTPLGAEGATTGGQVLALHAAEVWAGRDRQATAHLSLLLPRATDGSEVAPAGRRPTATPATPATPAASAAATAATAGRRPTRSVPRGSRPEFYDFDLFGPAPGTTRRSPGALEEISFTVIDTETTGLDPAEGDRIVSVGAVRVVHGRVLRQETFEQLVHPGRPVPAASTAIHGLSDAMLADAPSIEHVLPDLARFAEGTVLVGHNIGFDLTFLRPAARSAGVELRHPVLDTLLLDATLYPGQPDHTLEAIAARLGVSVVGRHTALGDALVTADVLVGLLGPLRDAGIRTLDDAVAASRRTFRSRAGDRDPADPA